MSRPFVELLTERSILVVAGAGGVGKTTTATAMALAAARHGRKVLALTVDPSKRLAQTLGVDRNLRTPVSIPEERLVAAGIEAPGALETWMLDPGLVADRVVRRLTRDEQEFERLTSNRIYSGLSRMVAGMQEYMAMEALHDFHAAGDYDLVILDTPPSRNALAFLDGPRRMAQFLDGRVFQLFKRNAESDGLFRRAAGQILNRVNSLAFGEETYADLQDFFDGFDRILDVLNSNAGSMMSMLQDPDDVAFLLVTSPTQASVSDAHYFRQRTTEMGLPMAGFVLNRSQALSGGRRLPEAWMLGDQPNEAAAAAYEKLQILARMEVAELERDLALLKELEDEAAPHAFALATPTLPGGANDMGSLLAIADALWEAELA